MALSDQLIDLAGRTKRLEDAAATAREKNQEKAKQQREKLQASMDASAKDINTKAAQNKVEAKGWWTETTAHLERRRAELKAKREQHETKQAVEAKQRYAEASEEYASMLTSLAKYVTDAAADAVLDASVAKAQVEGAAKEEVKSGA